jgi:hypothetical protein
MIPVAPACGRDGPAPAGKAAAPAPSLTGAPAADCPHALCAENFFVDAAPAPGSPACSAGAVCTLRLTLVATGDFHVNDEYPYRFKADDAAGVTFAGADDAAKNIFSKAAGDWTKVDARSGAMAVRFSSAGRGPATVAGVLKLSVCSGATCQLEQSRVAATVAVN